MSWLKTIVPIILGVALTTDAGAQWMKDGKPLADNSWRQQKDGFRVALLVVDDPDEFERRWKNGQPLDFSGVSAFERGSHAMILFVFNGCPEDDRGACDVVADFRVLFPDGTVALDESEQPFWVKASPIAPSIARARTGFSFPIDESVPAGEWTIHALVKDRVKGVTFTLERHFTVE